MRSQSSRFHLLRQMDDPPSRLSAHTAFTMYPCLHSMPLVSLLVPTFPSRTLATSLLHRADQLPLPAGDTNTLLVTLPAANCQCQARTFNIRSSACSSSRPQPTTAREERLSNTSTSWLSSGLTSAKMKPGSQSGSRSLVQSATRWWYAVAARVTTRLRTKVAVLHRLAVVEAPEAMVDQVQAMAV
jgi:hypothetical protein